MKYRAHTGPSLDSEIVYIHDVIKQIIEDPKGRERDKKYYSLWYLTPMVARCKGEKTPHFAFWPGSTSNLAERTNGMSLEHSTVQKWIEQKKRINLTHGYSGQKTYGSIAFSNVISEYQFKNSENGEIEYIADIYGKIEQDSILGLAPGTNLIIEIHKTNKVSKYKQAYYRKHNIAAIEVSIWEKVKFDTENADKISAINSLNSIVNNWLNKGTTFQWLHNPNYKNISRNKIQTEIKTVALPSNIIVTNTPLIPQEVPKDILLINKKDDICKVYKASIEQNESFIQRVMRFFKTLIKLE